MLSVLSGSTLTNESKKSSYSNGTNSLSEDKENNCVQTPIQQQAQKLADPPVIEKPTVVFRSNMAQSNVDTNTASQHPLASTESRKTRGNVFLKFKDLRSHHTSTLIIVFMKIIYEYLLFFLKLLFYNVFFIFYFYNIYNDYNVFYFYNISESSRKLYL